MADIHAQLNRLILAARQRVRRAFFRWFSGREKRLLEQLSALQAKLDASRTQVLDGNGNLRLQEGAEGVQARVLEFLDAYSQRSGPVQIIRKTRTITKTAQQQEAPQTRKRVDPPLPVEDTVSQLPKRPLPFNPTDLQAVALRSQGASKPEPVASAKTPRKRRAGPSMITSAGLRQVKLQKAAAPADSRKPSEPSLAQSETTNDLMRRALETKFARARGAELESPASTTAGWSESELDTPGFLRRPPARHQKVGLKP